MTWSIETVGIVILLVWIVVPIGEFRQIFRQLREQNQPDLHPDQDEGKETAR